MKYAGAQPTPAEVLQAFQTYTGYFGRFHDLRDLRTRRFLMHNQQGHVRPARNVDATKRFYEFTGNVLRLGGPPSLNEAGEMEGGHLYWERQLSID